MSAAIPAGWRFDESARPELHRVLMAACGELGAREDPPHSNRGPRVDVYTHLVGAPASRPGFPWCVAFVRWVYESSGLPFPRTWSVSELVDWGVSNERTVRTSPLLPGDVFCIERPRRPGSDEEVHHAGLIVCDLGDGRFAAVEGNHGDAVAATVRRIADVTAVLRILPVA